MKTIMESARTPNVICLICEHPFYVIAYRRKKGQGKYCSRRCYALAQCTPRTTHIPNRTCLVCSKPFYCEPRRLRRGHGKYCSHGCYGIAKTTTNPTITCINCGKTVTRRLKLYIIRRGQKFCSSKCMGAWKTQIARERPEKRCSACKKPKDQNQFYRNKNSPDGYGSICKPCSTQWRITHPTSIQQTKARYYKHHPERRRIDNAMRRAREKGAPYEHITLEEIYLRDSGLCQICHTETLPPGRGKPTEPKAPTIDHIVPVSDPEFPRIGHVRINVRLAHFQCNGKRWKHSANAQYLLFG
jgi:hypothetical protein